MERVAKSFRLQTVVNPETAEESQRIVVTTTMGEEVRLYLADKSIDDTVAEIKADKHSMLARAKFKLGDWGWFAYISNTTKDEEL